MWVAKKIGLCKGYMVSEKPTNFCRAYKGHDMVWGNEIVPVSSITYTTTDNEKLDLYEESNVDYSKPFKLTDKNLLYNVFENGVGTIITDGEPTTIGNKYGITNWGFINQSRLKTIEIPSNITAIGGGAFESCINLEISSLPTNVKSIGYNTFANCLNIKEFTINDDTFLLGWAQFMGCTNLEKVNIGNNVVMNDADSLFRDCTSLKEIWITDEVAPILYDYEEYGDELNPFYNIYQGGTLYYPKGADYSTWLSDKYLGKYGWNGVEVGEDEYIPLKYIYGGGGMGYFNTNIYPSKNTSIKVKYKMETYTSGTFIGNSSGVYRFFPYSSTNLYWDYEYGTSSKRINARKSSELNVVYIAEFGHGFINTYDENEVLIGNYSGTTSTAEWKKANTSPIYVFPNLPSTDTRARGYIEYCQIYENGELIRDYRPYLRTADNVAGFLDIVNDVFYQSDNDVPFVGVDDDNGISTMSVDYDFDDISGSTENNY